MSGGCPRIEQDDALKSPTEFEEFISSVEIYQLTPFTQVNQSHKLSSAEDQWTVKPGFVVMVARLIFPEWVPFERDRVPAATPHLGRKDVLLCPLHVTLKNCHSHCRTS